MTNRWHLAVLLGVLALSSPIVSACSRAQQVCSDRDSGDTPIDPTLLAFLSRARAAHHVADLQEDADTAAAVAALLAVVDGPIPGQKGTAPAEAREVIADTQARISDLESRLQRFDNALQRIESALGWVPETSYFRGHLFETRGIVEQRQAEEFAKSNRPLESAAAKARALIAFETAMQVQADVIRQTPADSANTASTVVGIPSHSSVPRPSEPRTTQGTHR
jgi:hypothetical protein